MRLLSFIILISMIHQSATGQSATQSKEIVRSFLTDVRSGKYPDRAADYMADTILAHQMNSENPVTVKRTPANYTAHVKEFIQLFGEFSFKVTELLADGNKVYARWIQHGKHLGQLDQYKPTGKTLIEYTSAVYLVENGKITEYWLQSDRKGFEEQLKEQAATTKH
jgi:predicted ester cyclase